MTGGNHWFKLGQMEIMGLAIVFVLVMLGVLFAIRFVITPQKSEFKKSFQETQLTSNMLSALKQTESGCSGTTITQLIQDCASRQSILCQNGMKSCQWLSEVAFPSIFSATLEKWHRSYYFEVRKGLREEGGPILGEGSLWRAFRADQNNGQQVITGIPSQSSTQSSAQSRCPGEKEQDSHPIPTPVGSVYLLLEVCSN